MKEYLYFVVEVAAPGYVKFTMNKCVSCQPYVAYTDDYKDFVAQNFETEEEISESLTYETVIKVKKQGALYFKVRSRDDERSILTVKSSFSASKIALNKARAGNKGNIGYNLVNSTYA